MTTRVVHFESIEWVLHPVILVLPMNYVTIMVQEHLIKYKIAWSSDFRSWQCLNKNVAEKKETNGDKVLTNCCFLLQSVCNRRDTHNPNPTISNQIQQTGISVGACSFSFWWRNQPNAYPGCNILRPGVADCRGLARVGFAWHAEDPGFEPGSWGDKKNVNFSPKKMKISHLR